MAEPSLIVQTTYAELLERCAAAGFSDAFPESGAFVPKAIKGRRYWYFQLPADAGRKQRYVGPETPELLARIAAHREARHDERERGALVSALIRLGMPRPNPDMGDVIAALADAGLFRLRGVLVGTVAYQTYSAMLGTKLPSQSLQTADVDIAQFASTSKAVDDRTIPAVDVLRKVDPSFAEVPNITRGRRAWSYQSRRRGLRVDFLAPNEGPETDEPQFLPALATYAQPLRFLDFLIHDPVPAALLHKAGVYVSVPAPERFAVHKLIIARRRSGAAIKRDKDIAQAAALVALLAERRSDELRAAWEEAEARGKAWRHALLNGILELSGHVRDLLVKSLARTRQMAPGLDLTFQNPPAVYVFDRDIVAFDGTAAGEPVKCAISREALEDHFGADGLDIDGRLEVFRRNRSTIEHLAREKYLAWPVEEPNSVLIRTLEVPELLRALPAGLRRRR
jgi:hypothetical protein